MGLLLGTLVVRPDLFFSKLSKGGGTRVDLLYIICKDWLKAVLVVKEEPARCGLRENHSVCAEVGAL